jgi:hypothetical protein
MGRPLKISKAQAVLTITATTATTNVVTVSQTLSTLGITKGMPFIPATTVGGLTGGTTYYVLAITGASTFTVSATTLNSNPTGTQVTLTTTTGQSVSATVGLVDRGFFNPNANATSSYGVVGGNTAYYGNQTIARVAIGQVGNGTIYATSGNANVFGLNTDFANTLGTTSAIQLVTTGNNGVNNYSTLGFVGGSVAGKIQVAVANTSATGNVIGTSGNAQTLFANQPVTFTANVGVLTTGTTYFVNNIVNAAAFTVSTSVGGANVPLTTTTGTANAVQDRVVLAAGATSNAVSANYIFSTNEAGYINRQKGKNRFLATGLTTGLTAQCTLANVANTALTANTMSVTATYANAATAKLIKLSDHQARVAYALTAGSFVIGNTYYIDTAGNTNFVAIGATSNVPGTQFTATGTGTGTGTAVDVTANPDVIATFNAANTSANVNPIVTIQNG